MAIRHYSVDQMAARVMHVPTPTIPKTPTATSATASTPTTSAAQPQADQAPSFTAVFAQIAAAAAAAGTTVASFAPKTGATAPAAITVPVATTTPAVMTGAPTTKTPGANDTANAPTDPIDTNVPPIVGAGQDGPAGTMFGPNPWLTDPTGQGPDGTVTHYNPVYFATQQTAQTVAQLIGGKVVQSVQITTATGSPFGQDEANYMVQLPNGGMVNPGFIADIYSHGWNQQFIDQQVAAEVAGAQPSINS